MEQKQSDYKGILYAITDSTVENEHHVGLEYCIENLLEQKLKTIGYKFIGLGWDGFKTGEILNGGNKAQIRNTNEKITNCRCKKRNHFSKYKYYPLKALKEDYKTQDSRLKKNITILLSIGGNDIRKAIQSNAQNLKNITSEDILEELHTNYFKILKHFQDNYPHAKIIIQMQYPVSWTQEEQSPYKIYQKIDQMMPGNQTTMEKFYTLLQNIYQPIINHCMKKNINATFIDLPSSMDPESDNYKSQIEPNKTGSQFIADSVFNGFKTSLNEGKKQTTELTFCSKEKGVYKTQTITKDKAWTPNPPWLNLNLEKKRKPTKKPSKTFYQNNPCLVATVLFSLTLLAILSTIFLLYPNTLAKIIALNPAHADLAKSMATSSTAHWIEGIIIAIFAITALSIIIKAIKNGTQKTSPYLCCIRNDTQNQALKSKTLNNHPNKHNTKIQQTTQQTTQNRPKKYSK